MLSHSKPQSLKQGQRLCFPFPPASQFARAGSSSLQKQDSGNVTWVKIVLPLACNILIPKAAMPVLQFCSEYLVFIFSVQGL